MLVLFVMIIRIGEDTVKVRGPKKLYLWQFLLKLIRDSEEAAISWTENPNEFIISDPNEVTFLIYFFIVNSLWHPDIDTFDFLADLIIY